MDSHGFSRFFVGFSVDFHWIFIGFSLIFGLERLRRDVSLGLDEVLF